MHTSFETKCKQCREQLSNIDIKKGKRFCNRKCSAIYNNILRGEKNSKTIECACGKLIKMKRYQNKKYCNSQCMGDDISKRASDNMIPIFLQGKITDRGTIKRVMLAMGVEHKCQLCGLTDWLGKPISMVLDHINGRADNNLPENLRLICHNCDSQTDHYKGRNKGNGRKALGLI
jgi:hypothetical protein